MGIVVGDVAGDEARLVAREVDILEAHIADAVAWGAVVLLAEEHAEAKECAALYLLDADVLEMDVAQAILVATAHREYAVAIFVENTISTTTRLLCIRTSMVVQYNTLSRNVL